MVCPAGKRLLGGGARVEPAVAAASRSSQSFPGNDNIYWGDAREVVATAANWTLTVYAVCGTAS